MLFKRPKQQAVPQVVLDIPEYDWESEVESRVTSRIGALMYEREAEINDLRSLADNLRGHLEAARSEVRELRIDLDIERRMGHIDALHRTELNNALSRQISMANELAEKSARSATPKSPGPEPQPPTKLDERMHYKRRGYTPTPTSQQADYLYVMRCGPYVKIGVSSDPERRLREVGVGAPDRVMLLGAWRHECAWKIEQSLHARFETSRTQGEWFVLKDEAVKLLIQQLDTDQLG